MEDDANFCTACGTKYSYRSYKSTSNAKYNYNPNYNTTFTMQQNNIPYQYRPLGAWTYFWLNVLFSIPIIGFIFLLIYSFNNQNINRRNFARSYWCIYLIYAILFFLFAANR